MRVAFSDFAHKGLSFVIPAATVAIAYLAVDFTVARSNVEEFRIQRIAEGLELPWAMAFLPDGTALVSERAAGRISLLKIESGESVLLSGGPDDVFVKDNAGMLDVVSHPDFESNNWIYYCYTAGNEQLNTMVVERAHLFGNEFEDRQRIFEALPWYHGSLVYGCRLVFKDDYLFVSMGDRWDVSSLSQSPGTHIGKVMRLHHDGSAPEDNPFASTRGALPEVWSLGNRNAQGLTLHPDTRDLWEHEHGPLGGDEINIIKPGLNYGWPVVSFGKQYSGEPVGEGLTEKEGMEPPVYVYEPSIAPSGMIFYTGDAFPGWRGDLFIGALALHHLNRLVIRDDEVVHEERLLIEQGWRIRFVEQGPDDLIYIGTDDGEIHRLEPSGTAE